MKRSRTTRRVTWSAAWCFISHFATSPICPRSRGLLGVVRVGKRVSCEPSIGDLITNMGPLAEARYLASHNRSQGLWPPAGDNLNLLLMTAARAMARDLEDVDPRLRFQVHGIDFGESILDDTWPQVEAIAAALRQRGTLTYAEARRIFDRVAATDNTPPRRSLSRIRRHVVHAALTRR